MLELFKEVDLINEVLPEDIFSGDGTTAIFDLVNLQNNVERVYVDEELIPSGNYTIQDNSGWEINFGTNIPPLGSNNIILQSDSCMLFPDTGAFNGYAGESMDFTYYVSNNDGSKGYSDVTVSPVDQIGGTQANWFKLALTQEELSGATAGASLSLGNITDTATAHGFWIRITVPAGYLGLNAPTETKYDLALLISGVEYDI